MGLGLAAILDYKGWVWLRVCIFAAVDFRDLIDRPETIEPLSACSSAK